MARGWLVSKKITKVFARFPQVAGLIYVVLFRLPEFALLASVLVKVPDVVSRTV